MAEAIPSKQEFASKLVQEIVKRGDEVPNVYLQKDDIPQVTEDEPDNLWTQTLLIDFALLSSPTTSVVELAKLRSALSDWGCFQVINHGIESSFLEEIIEVSKQFFALPLEEKLKCSLGGDYFQGYGNPSVYGDNLSGNWNDRLYLSIHPEESRNLLFWPENPHNFRKMVDEYSKKVRWLNEVILKAMAKSLDLPEDCFVNFQGEKMNTLGAFIMYPPCSCSERVLGVKPHTDGGTITILLADKNVQGLQVENNGRWFNVRVIPDTLFINLGDLGEVMTNGVFKSALHRVVTNSVKDRVSVVAFCSPETEKEIEPVSDMISTNRPQMYNKFSIPEYRQIYFENFKAGRRTIDAFKIHKGC
ncbi:protein LATERAL BRANCHING OXIDOREDUCTASE 1-like [Silene latifolia]|uniref:protein LATERAL BRANCHING OXIDOREDUCTASE 1-like n=1 Tax=Silene latifolia TaxID=37657 RepID=UPI003D782524